jgi:hypothetical protein
MGGGEVRLVGLVKRFDDVIAVDGVDLQVADAVRVLPPTPEAPAAPAADDAGS